MDMDYEAWKTDYAFKTAPASHTARHVTFNDISATYKRFENQNVSNAGPYYYHHWVNCYNYLGASNPHCRKCRYFAELYAEKRQIDEWDDWVKEEHFDPKFGQHYNLMDAEHFTEAANLLKGVREKRDEIVKAVNTKLVEAAKEDPMFKVRSAIASLTKNRKGGIKAAIEEGLISESDVQAAIKAKMEQLKTLGDDANWNKVKSSMKDDLTAFAKAAKPRLELLKKTLEKMRADIKKAGQVAFDIPHFKVDYEKPGMYEYNTWFGRFHPRNWQYGFVGVDEE